MSFKIISQTYEVGRGDTEISDVVDLREILKPLT